MWACNIEMTGHQDNVGNENTYGEFISFTYIIYFVNDACMGMIGVIISTFFFVLGMLGVVMLIDLATDEVVIQLQPECK